MWLHEHGLYKAGNCVCHRPVAAADDGVGESVELLLREAGVDVRRVSRRTMEEEDQQEDEEAEDNSDA